MSCTGRSSEAPAAPHLSSVGADEQSDAIVRHRRAAHTPAKEEESGVVAQAQLACPASQPSSSSSHSRTLLPLTIAAGSQRRSRPVIPLSL